MWKRRCEQLIDNEILIEDKDTEIKELKAKLRVLEERGSCCHSHLPSTSSVMAVPPAPRSVWLHLLNALLERA